MTRKPIVPILAGTLISLVIIILFRRLPGLESNSGTGIAILASLLPFWFLYSGARPFTNKRLILATLLSIAAGIAGSLVGYAITLLL